MSSKKGILYGRSSWKEECRGGVYEKDKEGYFNDHKYEGEIENEKPHGNGTWIQMDGGTYVGQFVNGQREGLGTFTWSEKSPQFGKVYEGEWKDNSPNGKGKIYYERGGDKKFEGMSWEGEFRNGKDWNVTIYSKDRSIFGEYKDGEIVDGEIVYDDLKD